jgi:hypothetical protein
MASLELRNGIYRVVFRFRGEKISRSLKTRSQRAATALLELKRRRNKPRLDSVGSGTREWERSRQRKRSGWLAPIEIDEHHDPSGPDCSDSGRRASDKGFLSSISLARYLELLDWTGRQVRRDKAGRIPLSLRPILERLGLEPAAWCDLVKKFGRLFKRAAGSPDKMAAEASRRAIPGCSALADRPSPHRADGNRRGPSGSTHGKPPFPTGHLATSLVLHPIIESNASQQSWDVDRLCGGGRLVKICVGSPIAQHFALHWLVPLYSSPVPPSVHLWTGRGRIPRSRTCRGPKVL